MPIHKTQSKIKSELKKMEHEGNGDANFNWRTWSSPQSISKETGRLGNKRINENHPDYSIFKIGQNTKKSPGDLKRLAVTQTPVENHQLTLVWKTIKRVK